MSIDVSNSPPRLRMFAGPNGSGKTTVKIGLSRPADWFGIYINPDEIEKSIVETGTLPLEPFGFTSDTAEVQRFFQSSTFLQSHHLSEAAAKIECFGGSIDFSRLQMNSYYASVLADFLRRKAVESSKSFSFETVMSSRDKVDLLEEARSRGFRTYLYYVATEDPAINVRRVRIRVAEGGHDVPEEKIISRYYRTLNLLPEAVRHTDRAFFFDTTDDACYFAEVTNGKDVVLKSDRVPDWFERVMGQP